MQALLRFWKGNGVNIPQPGCGYCMATQQNLVMQKGALGSVVFSSLLCLYPEIRLPGDRVN